MDPKKKIAIVFGGRSTEHEISLLSAQNVIRSLDTSKYEAVLIGIDKSGKWHLNTDSLHLMHADDPSKIALAVDDNPVLLSQNAGEKSLIDVSTGQTLSRVDVIFPVLHGLYGEDGSIQGLARLANIPCVGCSVLGSAIGMDKDIMKRLLRDADVAVADFVTIRPHTRAQYSYEEISKKLGRELFLKPANLGSSVGVSRVDNAEAFEKALDYGFLYDPKVVVEEKIVGREIECAVMGNEEAVCSIPGEVIPRGGFYSYENKYLDEAGAELMIPAKLSPEDTARIQALALHTYQLLECEGMARVDMFMCADGKLIINEINTIPGFTGISMYPKLWEYSGVTNQALISRLIELAIESHEKRNTLKIE